MSDEYVRDDDHDARKVSIMAGTSFTVADMTCSHCVGTVRAAIERVLPGVPVEIDLSGHLVTVAGDPAIAAAAIRAAGYTAELASSEPHVIGSPRRVRWPANGV